MKVCMLCLNASQAKQRAQGPRTPLEDRPGDKKSSTSPAAAPTWSYPCEAGIWA